MIKIRKITEEELKDNIIMGQDFPELISTDSSDFFYNKEEYIDNCEWYGAFNEDELISVCCVSLPNDEEISIETLETKIDCRDNGYGKALMDWLVNKYGSLYNLSLMGMYKDLDKFYSKWGFKEIQREPVLKMIRKRK